MLVNFSNKCSIAIGYKNECKWVLSASFFFILYSKAL